MLPALWGSWKKNWLHLIPPVIVGMLGVYVLWRAMDVDGAMADRMFVIGLLLCLCSVATMWRFRSKLGDRRERELQSKINALGQEVRRLDAALTQMQLGTAASALRDAVDQADVHSRRRSWIQVVREEPPGT